MHFKCNLLPNMDMGRQITLWATSLQHRLAITYDIFLFQKASNCTDNWDIQPKVPI